MQRRGEDINPDEEEKGGYTPDEGEKGGYKPDEEEKGGYNPDEEKGGYKPACRGPGYGNYKNYLFLS